MPTANGKKMPIDAEPNPKGNIMLRDGAPLIGANAEHLRDGEAHHRDHR